MGGLPLPDIRADNKATEWQQWGIGRGRQVNQWIGWGPQKGLIHVWIRLRAEEEIHPEGKTMEFLIKGAGTIGYF